MLTLWILLIDFLALECKSAPEKSEVGMVETIRRQLMHENYDYMEGSDSDAITTTLEPPPDAEDEQVPLNEYIVPGAPHLPAPIPDQMTADHKLNGKPVAPALHTLDDTVDHDTSLNQLTRRAEKEDLFYNPNVYYQVDSEIDDEMTDAITSEPTPHYKILKAEGISGRRSGNKKPQIFLQEERDGHIAIVNLGGGPFPEFRLPKSRRQYMADDFELNAIENEIMPEAKPNQIQDEPLPLSQEGETTTIGRKKSRSEEYGLKMSSTYERLVEERNRMRKNLSNLRHKTLDEHHEHIGMHGDDHENANRDPGAPPFEGM